MSVMPTHKRKGPGLWSAGLEADPRGLISLRPHPPPIYSVPETFARALWIIARLDLVGANRRPDAVMALHGRTPGQGRGNPPIHRTPDIDKNARLWPDRTRDGQCVSRAETE